MTKIMLVFLVLVLLAIPFLAIACASPPPDLNLTNYLSTPVSGEKVSSGNMELVAEQDYIKIWTFEYTSGLTLYRCFVAMNVYTSGNPVSVTCP